MLLRFVVVAPVGDAVARELVRVAPRGSVERASSPPSADELEPSVMTAPDEPPYAPVFADGGLASRRVAGAKQDRATGADGGVRGPEDVRGAKPSGSFVVPAASVTTALERRDVGAVSARGVDGRPRGARLRGVSRYGTGLRDGDVIVSVEGAPTPTVEAMVAVAMRALEAGARQLHGVVVRGEGPHEERFAVVLEVPR